jgi:hypothetical protein
VRESSKVIILLDTCLSGAPARLPERTFAGMTSQMSVLAIYRIVSTLIESEVAFFLNNGILVPTGFSPQQFIGIKRIFKEQRNEKNNNQNTNYHNFTDRHFCE